MPVAAAVPVAMPVASNVQDGPQPAVIVPQILVQRGRTRKRSRGFSPQAVALTVLIVGALGVAGVTTLGITGNLPAPLDSAWDFVFAHGFGGKGHEFAKFNYRFDPPERPWVSDKVGMKVDFAYRRSSPNRWMAVAVKDYKDRSPRDSDLQDEILQRLRPYFKDMEYGALRDITFAEKPAKVLEFQGQVNSVEMNGECVMLSSQGIGYWFLTWSPLSEKAEAVEEWPALRGRFSLMNERDGWSKDQRKMGTAQGEKAAYTLRFAEAIWVKDDPGSADQAAEISLLGSDPNLEKDASRMATAQVLLLPKQDSLKDAGAATKEYILKMQKDGGYPATEQSVMTDKDGELDRKGEVGNREGRIIQIQVRNGEARQRYVLAAVVPVADHTVAIVCECDYRRREFWQQEFLALIEKFQAKPAGK